MQQSNGDSMGPLSADEKISYMVSELNRTVDSSIDVAEMLLNEEILSQVEKSSVFNKWTAKLTSMLVAKSQQVQLAGTILVMISVDQSWQCLSTMGFKWIKHLYTIASGGEHIRDALLDQCLQTIQLIMGRVSGLPALTRDIAIPMIAPLCTTLLSLHEKPRKSNLIRFRVLETFGLMMLEYPSQTRTFANKLFPSVWNAYSQSQEADGEYQIQLHRVFALFPYTAPKGSSATQWSARLDSVLFECHICLNNLFRPISEGQSP